MTQDALKRALAATLMVSAIATVAWLAWGRDAWLSRTDHAGAAASAIKPAPDQLRDFLARAEAADKISDPVERCLAFPDLPGNHWPEGIVKLECEYAHASNIELSRMAELLDAGRATELDELFAADLDRHFSDQAFSEIIHSDFNAIDASPEADRLTTAWLRIDPASAYAIAARATYLESLAWQLRGPRVVKYTPEENFRRMRAPAEQAVPLFQQAVRKEPRLLPAYSSMMSLGLLLSRPRLLETAYKSAAEVDPGCANVTSMLMTALSPKWGGSYEQMHDFAEWIAPQTHDRPLLLNFRYRTEVEAAHNLLHDNRASEVIPLLRPVVLKTPSPTGMEELGAALRQDPEGDLLESLVVLVEASRFSTSSAIANYNRGVSLLWQAKKPEWASRYLKLAVDSEPEDGQFHLYLGGAYQAMKKYSEADHEYELAMKDEKQRANAMNELIVSRIEQKRLDDARKTSDAQVLEFPDFAIGWSNRYYLLHLQNDPDAMAALRRFIEVADPDDPKTKQIKKKYAAAIKRLKAQEY